MIRSTKRSSEERHGKAAAVEPDHLSRIAGICEQAALGDLEARVVGLSADPRAGQLSRSVNHMLDIADSFVREAAAAMEACAQDRFHRPILLRGLKGAYRKSAATINKAGVKMQERAGHLAFTARLAGETASNVNMIAAACEELNSTSSEISRQAAESVRLTGEAVSQGSSANDAVTSLSTAARKIDSIVSLIDKIAAQTNLLALNATIEAARVGEQGRGFAVVANEVKELSKSCAKATKEISQQVEMMHQAVKQVAGYIHGFNGTIAQITAGASNIASSVAEQVQATGDISRNITEASRNTTSISERISNNHKNGERSH